MNLSGTGTARTEFITLAVTTRDDVSLDGTVRILYECVTLCLRVRSRTSLPVSIWRQTAAASESTNVLWRHCPAQPHTSQWRQHERYGGDFAGRPEVLCAKECACARLHVIRVADKCDTRSQGSQTGGGSHSTRREDITLAPESQQLLMELGDEHQARVVDAIVAAHLS